MNRIKVFGALVGLLAFYQFPQQSSAAESIASVQVRIAKINSRIGPLRTWYIFKLLDPDHPVQEINWVTFHYKPTVELSTDELLFRPEKNLRCVAIIRKESDRRLSFNPEGYNYGPIPAAQAITVSLADELFSKEWPTKGLLGSDVERTYELCLSNGTSCFLDLSFKDNKCQKFRVRCSSLGPAEWFEVN